MTITFSSKFRKEYKSFPKNVQNQVLDRLELFSKNKNNPQLNNHKLQGEYSGFHSINISGDIRAIYEFLDKNTVLFIKIGTHSQLY